MGFGAETIDLPEGTFTILRELIRERSGIWFESDRRDLLADKLAPRVLACGFASFLDYYYLLKYGPGDEAEWPRVMDALSVQETYFWREFDQVRALADVLVPRFVADHPGEPVRVWCAACATGEEPLSIAMALAEAGWLRRAAVEVYASDASQAALDRAGRGLYRERSFRSLPAALRGKYFEPAGDAWRVAPELHARVRWARANLLDAEAIAPFARSPFVFCRNVFIYFAPAAIARAVSQFAARMPSPGYLFVGAAESLLKLSTDFELQEIGGAFVYVKR